MTKQERLVELKREIDILRSQIKLEEDDAHESFLDDAVGNYIAFMDYGIRRYMYVDRRDGNILGGNSFTKYESGIETTDGDYYTFDKNITDYHILTKNDAKLLMKKEFELWLDNMEY